MCAKSHGNAAARALETVCVCEASVPWTPQCWKGRRRTEQKTLKSKPRQGFGNNIWD